MIPSRIVFPGLGVPLCSVQFPVHDPPVIWKSFRGQGGNPGVEFGPHPILTSQAIRRIDVNDLTWLEPVNQEGKANG